MINENDTTATDEISFGDNDFLAAQVAILIGADLLLLTDTDGLHTADPNRDPKREVGPRRDGLRVPQGARDRGGELTARFGWDALQGRRGGDGHGGGHPDLDRQRARPRPIVRARRGERVGTRFHTQAARVSSFKLWLKYAKPSHGQLLVDSGAERALRERGTSLLPVGVRAVEGDFDAGDAVRVADGQRQVGKGIVNYSAAELRRIKGMKTADVQAIVARPSAEAVHRDYFVLD